MSSYYPHSETNQIGNISFLYELFLGCRTTGTFVEVGGYDGFSHSPSWGLAVRGWSGLYIEPIPAYADRCRDRHRGHPAVTVVEFAASSSDGWITLHEGESITTTSAEQVDQCRALGWGSLYSGQSITVPARTLDGILTAQGVEPHPDVLTIDVEGHEEDVFNGFSLAQWMPLMLIVELHDTSEEFRWVQRSHRRVAETILANNYEIVHKDTINTVFVRCDRIRAAYDGPSDLSLKQTATWPRL